MDFFLLRGYTIGRMADEPSASTQRLAALIQRSAELGEEMRKTADKMKTLTEQMAKEAETAKANRESWNKLKKAKSKGQK